MALPEEKLEQELVAAVREILGSDERDNLTVNYIRNRVQDKLSLPADFFKAEGWKLRSKDVITDAVNQFHTEEDTTAAPSSQPEPAAKHNKAKRQSSEEPSPPPRPKRAKKEAAPKPTPAKRNAPKKNNKKETAFSSDLSDLAESEEEPPPKRGRKAPSKKQKAEDSSSDLSELDEPVEEPKRRGKKATPAEPQDSDSALSDLGSSSESENEQEGKKPKKTAPRHRPNKASGEEDPATDSDESSTATRKKRKRAPLGTKKATKGAASESQPEGASEQEPAAESNAGTASLPKGDTAKATTEEASQERPPPARTAGESKPTVDDESSEMSSVLDEPLPKKKRKTKEPRKPKTKAPGKAALKELTGDEVEIKKLQGQLVKCGIRKIWGIELKQHGDDSRAKVRHLKKMLSDVGMSGRFSEARAKEIKEQRELMADLEAVQEMDNLWGGAGGPRGRASRSKAKTAVQAKPAEEDRDEEAEAKPRVSKRMADLAFLGSESESE